MKHNSMWTAFGASLGMLILILDSKTAFEGASEGMILCMQVVVPSLFPFFVLSALLTSSLSNTSIGLLQPFRQLCDLSPGCEGILISGFLGGYPVGAQCVAQSYKAGFLTKKEAERMLAFCSNTGPAFLFGMVGPMFSHSWMPWALWIIHITSALITASFFPSGGENAKCVSGSPVSVSQALLKSIRIMGLVCGWIILFRVFLAFLRRWFLWFFPADLQVVISGVLELSNGCYELGKIAQEPIRFVVASGMLAMGGVCVVMQTKAVAGGLSLRCYYIGKILQTVFSLIFSWTIIYRKWYFLMALLLILLYYPRKNQKSSSISLPLRV